MSRNDPEDDVYAYVEATPGFEITITFNEATDGGYIWECDADDDVDIRSEVLVPEDDGIDEPRIGTNFRRQFTVSSVAEGEHELTFRHQRPFEDAPEEVVKVKLKIVPKQGF